jgi:putative tricarboxylic transport membrane protein
MDHLLAGFAVALGPNNLFYCFVGVLLGTVAGILPGLGPLTTIAILLPMTYKMDVTSSIIMLSGIYYGVAYGGTVTSVLMRVPGETSSTVTCLDGYEMARKGRAGAALGIAACSSFIAGTVGVVAMSIISQPVTNLIFAFGPAEYAMLMLSALIVVTYFSGGALARSLLMAAFGLLLGTVGSDPLVMTPRLTFGSLTLAGGIDLVALAIGLFALPEILALALRKPETLRVIPPPSGLLGFVPSRDEAGRSIAPTARGTVLGFCVGLLPGGGAAMASFLAYALERWLSRRPAEFGRGAVEAVAGPEAANNAGVQGALVPLLLMGLPANPTTAMLLGGFLIHDVTPGPMIIQKQPEMFWGIVASMYIGNVLLLILNLPLIGFFVRILLVPRAYLATAILVLCLVGLYSANGNPVDVLVACVLGFVGYVLRRHGFDLSIVVLAFVLGPLLERSARQALSISDGSLAIFVQSPISITLALVSASALVAGIWPRRKVAAIESPGMPAGHGSREGT